MVAALASFMPLHDFFTTDKGSLSILASLAAVAFGYGIPYTFISGFEIKPDADEEVSEEKEREALEGGIEADLLDAEEEEYLTEPSDEDELDEPEEEA